ncbi:gliding motility-associated ABC transporter substrate-binding protein GldG [Tenacibaculum jejuense]|uniref:Gliding motility protein GldG n=1 Tax=Tenacibaculum jejuense TaxID=584609 RepID=A0A238U814_9FLAO|nr:gliding motility-associated ABC transporter substrate-binding protein GldG [Tenacibaculum jejuense]SNR15333.1 Gliding motility protein GldG [Tenacibaculum jejuense]
MNKKFKNIVIVIVGILVLNFLSNSFFKRFDLTKDKRYTLSEVTVDLLNELDTDLIINVYLEGDFPSEFQRLQIETRQFLEELEAKNRNVRFRFIDPYDIRQELIKNGMMPSQLSVEEDGKLSEAFIFPWAEIFYKNRSQKVSLLSNSLFKTQEEQLENAIAALEHSFASGIEVITQEQPKTIAVISGIGELEDIKLYSFLSELGKKYRLAKFTLDSVNKNPEKTLEQLKKFNLSIIAKPTKKFTPKEKLTLDQYIMNGGKTLWMIDNLSADTDSLYNQGKMLAFPRDLNLTDLLFSYGVRVNNKLVQDLYASKLTLAAGNTGNQTQFENFNWFYHPLVTGNPSHPITKNVLPVRFRFTTQLDTLQKNVKKTPLLVSSVLTKLSGTPKIIELESITQEPKQQEYGAGSQLLAVLLEGEFESAYRSRTKPFDSKNYTEKSKSNRMVVIADGDIGKNQLLKGKPYDLGIDKWTQERFGNKDFLVNTVDYLLDDNGLIDLKNKSVQLRVLDKKRAYSEKKSWQLFNIVLPISLLLAFGFVFNYLRKRKYS